MLSPSFLQKLKICLSLSLLCSLGIAEIKRNYTYSYFENGYPKTESGTPRGLTYLDDQARANPDLVFQTGYYSLRLECDTMKLTGFDKRLDDSNYLSALTEDVTTFTPADLSLYAYIGNEKFICTSGIVFNDTPKHFVRFIEGGQFMQRIDHTRLVFSSETTDAEIYGRLEIATWPDHVTFTLDMSENTDVTRSTIVLTSPAGEDYLDDHSRPIVQISLKPHEDLLYPSLSPSDYIVSAQDPSGDELSKTWDNDLSGIRVDFTVPDFDSDSLETNPDTVFEVDFTVTNPTGEAINLPLVFSSLSPRAIAGTMMMLCDEEGRPLGIPVQVSKNWHNTIDTVHYNEWLRGYTMMPLGAGVTKSFKLRVVHGYWADGSVGAVSHSSLSLIGYSDVTTWKWDEAAMGAWGESMTFDISQHAGGSVVGDVRPTFTTPMDHSGTHDWTENVGGGDFLNYYDSSNTYIMSKKLKTCYRWNGPNMTEVLYSGVTADNKIRFIYTTQGLATFDYHRRINKYRYEFLEPVTTPRRLVFYQMAADRYLGPTSTEYHYGDSQGLEATETVITGGNSYEDGPILMTDRWLAIDDDIALDGTPTKANRGLYMTESKLNGNNFDTYVHPYQRTWGSSRLLYDFAGSAVDQSYSAGDIIEGGVVYIMPPKTASNYWGYDTEFSNRLSNYTEAWEGVYDDFANNHELNITAHAGIVANSYPVEIQADDSSLLADFTINEGGIGHVPIIIQNVKLGTKLEVEIFENGGWTPLPDVTLDEHAYYQAYLNADGKLDYTFSIKRPTDDLTESWRVRINGEIGHFQDWLASYPSLHYAGWQNEDDSDHDSKDILIEYMLNTNPLTCEQDSLPQMSQSNGNIYLQFNRHAGSAAESNQILQYSTDLDSWTNVALTGVVPSSVTVGAAINDLELITVTLDENLATDGKLFWRLWVELDE